jgi:predicted RNase H-like HicB family nuclease
VSKSSGKRTVESWASVPDLPGVMAYGGTEDEAIRRIKSIALQVLADMIESGEEVPEPLKVLFAA